jgi:3',5'-cyclic AMP phosphodiesterase CpdA
MELLQALLQDLRVQTVDHMALTGDLSNVSLEGEFRVALRWIEATGAAPDAVTVIPGNHDAYVPAVVESRIFERLFGAYQTADVRSPQRRTRSFACEATSRSSASRAPCPRAISAPGARWARRSSGGSRRRSATPRSPEKRASSSFTTHP